MKYWQRIDGAIYGKVEEETISYGEKRFFDETHDACSICGMSLYNENGQHIIRAIDMLGNTIIKTCNRCGYKFKNKKIPKKFLYKLKTSVNTFLHSCIEYGEKEIDGIRIPFFKK